MATGRKLAQYQAKRDFSKTREPSGRAKTKTGHSYLIQKHAARRLHYDFRIEMDGVLKSWAVTRGPSLNPEDKRLAVHVEDHPIAYGSFEGTIPQGEYGGGTVMLWDQGTWEPIGDPERSYKKGNFTFDLHGKRLKGRWHLVRMHSRPNGKAEKHENWLLIKGKDEYANDDGESAIQRFQKSAASSRTMKQIAKGDRVWHSKTTDGADPKEQPRKSKPKTKPEAQKLPAKAAELPDFVAPQLATLVDKPPEGDAWTHEIKFDGYRLLARIEAGKVQLLTRAHNDWTPKFKDLAKHIEKLSIKSGFLDGEVVHRNADGTMSFHGLQNALSTGDTKDLHYHIFDLMFLDGNDYRHLPLSERKAALKGLLKKAPPDIHYSEDFHESGNKMLHHACQIALEGIVSKKLDATYFSGRNNGWLKSKCTKEQELVIGGYTLQSNHSGTLGALLTGFHKKGELVFGGKVGTGFTQSESADLLKKLNKLKRTTNPFASVPTAARRGAIWVEPKLVGQFHFAEWTPDGHMRHPSYGGLREDKPAPEVIKEQPKPIAKMVKAKNETARTARAHKTPPAPGDAVIAGVKLSHPDKEMYKDGTTKRELAAYYDKVARLMLPHVVGRPISLLRCPSGEGGQCFFQRHGSDTLSPYVKPVKVSGHGDGQPFLMIEDIRGLIGLVQMSVLEVHVWGSHAADPTKADRLVFDLDPAPDVKFTEVKKSALQIRDHLKEIKLHSFLKTTGGKGLHVVVPFIPGPAWKAVKNFARAFSETMAKAEPDRFTINSRKDVRKGRIYLDYLRNDETASSVAPYSTRAREGAPISLPIDWKDLTNLKAGNEFTFRNIDKFLKKDPWKDMARTKQKLPL